MLELKIVKGATFLKGKFILNFIKSNIVCGKSQIHRNCIFLVALKLFFLDRKFQQWQDIIS